MREGDYSYDVLAIEEGTARVDRDGEHVAELGPGDVVGEMGVLERAQRNATVVATSPMLPGHAHRAGTSAGCEVRARGRRAPARRSSRERSDQA